VSFLWLTDKLKTPLSAPLKPIATQKTLIYQMTILLFAALMMVKDVCARIAFE
jgi:hypothetical protein